MKSSSLAVDAGELADVCRSLESCGIRGDMEAARTARIPRTRPGRNSRCFASGTRGRVHANENCAHILTVEDDPVQRLRVRDPLEEGGYDISQAESGEAALSSLAASRADGILLDIGLPGMGGLEVLRELRKMPGMLGSRSSW